MREAVADEHDEFITDTREEAGSVRALPEEERSDVRVLVVDDDTSTLKSCESVLGQAGYSVDTIRKAEEARPRIRRQQYDVLLIDQRMPEIEGVELVRLARDESPDALPIVITGYASTEHSLKAMRAGAWDYLPKPFTATQLLVLVGRASHRVRRLQAIAERSEEDGRLVDGEVTILGTSDALQRVVRRALKVADTSAPVFVSGETGSGKELIARLIHAESRRREEQFTAVNCAALPAELLESELFGHREGAFTGAVREKPGLLEVTDGGTFFLDELCEMPTALQPKLLRVLQDGVVRRVGSEEVDAEVDLRFVSATNRDVQTALEDGELRRDLYYRLKVIHIRMPPLRERREDVPILARHFARKYWEEHDLRGDGPPEIRPEVMRRLKEYRWPGNVRELENMMEQLVVLSDPADAVTLEDLPETEAPATPSGAAADGNSLLAGLDLSRPYHEAKEELVGRFERMYLATAIREADGNMSEAARQADIDRTTLYRLLEKHDLDKDDITA